MTLTWDETTIAWDNVDYDWEGGFLAPSTAPYQFFAATSTFDPTMVAQGSLAAFAATNQLLDYTATGVVED